MKDLTSYNCYSKRSISPGTFIFVNNKIRSSLCIRSPKWLEGSSGTQSESNSTFPKTTSWEQLGRPHAESRRRQAERCWSVRFARHSNAAPRQAHRTGREEASGSSKECESLPTANKGPAGFVKRRRSKFNRSLSLLTRPARSEHLQRAHGNAGARFSKRPRDGRSACRSSWGLFEGQRTALRPSL